MLNRIDAKMRKMLIIFGALILLVLIMLLFLGGNKNYSFDKIENIMVRSAERYFKDNASLLPKTEGSTEVVSGMRLEDGYMKKMSSMRKDGVVCNGEVRVMLFNDEYHYTPYLNCGEDYVTRELHKYLVEKNLVTTGAGLYKVGDDYIYRGSEIKNFIEFSGRLFRIMKIDASGKVRIIENESISDHVWDVKYNPESPTYSGINVFENKEKENSEIYTYLKKYAFDKKNIDEKDISKLDYIDVCYGSRSFEETSKNNTVECTLKTSDFLVSMPTVSDFLAASLDDGCNKTMSSSCYNYNYMAKFMYSFWTSTPVSSNNYEVYYIDKVVKKTFSENSFYVKPVLNLNKNVIFVSGDGSLNKPYIMK